MKTTASAVLDACAMFCFLKDENGADRVEKYFKLAIQHEFKLFLNMMNAGEVFYITFREEGEKKALETWHTVKNLPIEIVHNDEKLVLKAAQLKAQYSFSYADSFAAMTSMNKEAILITADPEFKAIEHLTKIDWLPAKK